MRTWALVVLLVVGFGGCGGGGGGGGTGPGSSGPFAGGPVSHVPGIIPIRCLTGHFDGDARLDLVVLGALPVGANDYVHGIEVYRGLDGGLFELAAPTTFTLPVPSETYLVLAGHFDLDANLDLVVLNAEDFLVLLGNGNGTFDAATSAFGVLIAGHRVSDATVVDANGDLYSDLAYGTVDGRAGFLLGDGAGGFAPGGEVIVAPGPVDGVVSVAPGFIDPDDDVDLAALDSTGIVTTLHGDGSGGLAFAQALVVSVPVAARRLLVGKFGLAGGPNLAVAEDSPVKVHFLPGDGAGGFTLTGAQLVTFPDERAGSLALVRESVLADDSLLLRVEAAQLAPNGLPAETLYLIRSDGSGGFAPRSVDEAMHHAMCFAAADLDRDWRTDLVIAGMTAAGDDIRSFVQVVYATGN